MRILGIDPGVTTGFATINVNPGTATWEVVDRQVQKLSDSDDGLLGLYYATREIVMETLYPMEVAMEQLLTYRLNNMDEGIEARGVVKFTLQKINQKWVTYAPTTIRACVFGSGRASPKEIRQTIKFLCGIKKGTKLSDHEADAIGVALTHAVRVHGLILDKSIPEAH